MAASREGFIAQRVVILDMEKATPDDLTTDQLYEMLTDNPNAEYFTPEDIENYL